LRTHVLRRAAKEFQFAPFAAVGAEPEVYYFYLVATRYQDVFSLQVSVADLLAVAVRERG
jgi:hypothetical protein